MADQVVYQIYGRACWRLIVKLNDIMVTQEVGQLSNLTAIWAYMKSVDLVTYRRFSHQ